MCNELQLHRTLHCVRMRKVIVDTCDMHSACSAVQLVRPCKQLTYRLTGAVITDGLVLFAVDLDHWMKDLSYGVCPVIEDALLKARYGGRGHCREKRYTIDIAL